MKRDKAHYDAVWRAEQALQAANQAPKIVKQALARPKSLPEPVEQMPGEDHPARIPTRLVTSKKGRSDQTDDVDMASFKSTPELYQKNIDLLRKYPNMRKSVAGKGYDAVAGEMIRHVKENLLDLHDRVPEEIRNRSKLWYDGARNITDRWMKDYNLPDHSVAGTLAALSPQKDWYQNVSLAKRVLDRMRGNPEEYRNLKFSPEMEATWKGRDSLNKPKYEPILNMLRGKSLHDIDQLGLPDKERAIVKAAWIRMHDETHNDPSHPIITPEGGEAGPMLTDKGANAKVGWGSLGEIAKAVRSIESAGNPQTISGLMGEKHKVRNFYNNILSPNAKHGDVTIDTHAVAAGLMRALSGNSLEVAHNFSNHPGVGIPAAGGSALTGIQGLYPIYAEAYRQAAKERGIRPREMQSITWEAIRGLFPDTFKTDANNALVDRVWGRYRSGAITQAQARDQIHELAGGIRPPTWFAGADAANQGAANAGELPRPGVPGPSTGQVVAGGGGGPAAAVPPVRAQGGRVVRANGGDVPPVPPQQPGSALDTPSYIKPIDEGARVLSPIGLYSHAAEETWKQPQMKGSPEQFKAMLTKRGVKPDEFKWSGYDQAMAGKNVVTKREVRDHFVKHLPKIEETVLSNSSKHASNYDYDPDTGVTGGPKYEDYQLPGGRNYREVVLHLPETKTNAGVELGGPPGKHDTTNYHSSHWDEPNPLLHLRMSDREGPVKLKYAWRNKTSGNTTKTFDSADEAQRHLATLPEKLHGNLAMVTKPVAQKILHVEELQSDWGQAAREHGTLDKQLAQTEKDELSKLRTRMYAAPDRQLPPTEEARRMELEGRVNEEAKGKVPPAPYIDSTAKWTDLGLKRALHEAAKGGYDKLVITPGEEQAERYDLSHHIDEIRYGPRESFPGKFDWVAKKDGEVAAGGMHGPEEIARHVGKEIADKMVKGEGTYNKETDDKSLRGFDLKVGGEGMKGYYDKVLPIALQKLAKQHDPEAKVELGGYPLKAKHDIHDIEDRDVDGITVGSVRTTGSVSKTHRLHSIDITPKMRASLLQGQKGYAGGGRVSERLHDDIYRKLRKVVTAGSYPGSSVP